MINAAVYGARGYGGGELLRLLLTHPDVSVAQATSREPGGRLDEMHPGLRGLTDLILDESKPEALGATLDAVFLALPHGESTAVADAVSSRCPKARVFDLAQDFRTGHEANGWVYGFPEMTRSELATAQRIACPGCFATAILLGTVPAFNAGLAPQRVIVDAKTGSSGSGAEPTAGTHHPVRTSTLRAYKVFDHQHEREIQAAWSCFGKVDELPRLSFVPQSAPLVRGIYACCYLVYGDESPAGVRDAYQEFYRDSPFVRVTADPPNVLHVRGTNNADLFIQDDGGVVLAIAAIDNLVRGAAGQAVQCMNLAFGLQEERGLRLTALVP